MASVQIGICLLVTPVHMNMDVSTDDNGVITTTRTAEYVSGAGFYTDGAH